MKISLSSAEFDKNHQTELLLFGPNNKCKPVTLEEIEKLPMWDNYKTDIKTFFNSTAVTQRDLNGQLWISIGGSGWGYHWTTDNI